MEFHFRLSIERCWTRVRRSGQPTYFRSTIIVPLSATFNSGRE